jgi:hypothetical protein
MVGFHVHLAETAMLAKPQVCELWLPATPAAKACSIAATL